MKLGVSDIVVGKRFRKDMGDLDALAASIADLGLLQPLVVRRSDRQLIAGRRRLEAVKRLGWDQVPVYLVAGLDETLVALRAERDENTCRKDFLPTERAQLERALLPQERAKAQERQKSGKSTDGKAGGRGRAKPGGNFPPGFKAKSRDRVGAALGISGRTVQKEIAVVEAAEAQPEVFGDLPDLMDSKSTESAFKELKRRQRQQEKQAQLEAQAQQAATQGPPPWEIRCGDVLQELAKLASGSVDLVFADPPYNIGVDYGEGARADSLPDEEYLAWCRQWIAEVQRVLSPHGTFWLLIDDKYADYLGVELRQASFHRRAWVKWYETFGVCNSAGTNFSRCSRHLFYSTKHSKKYVFHLEAVTRPSDRQTKHNDKRANPDGKVWDDVWEIPRLVGTAKERLPDFPTQLPLALLTPIVGCCSNPGDLVLDPFNGSGTTGAAALLLKRRYLGIEKQAKFVQLASLRLKGVSSHASG
jgi:site-specific DNA-methyltransferase (adenine-specific)